jgi:hypothetical protein
MTITRPLSVLLVLGLSASALACVRAPTAAIPNPLTAGSVSENELKFRDNMNEQQLGIQAGSLEHDAALVSADEKQLCFRVKLHTARKDLSTPKGWRVFLRGKPSFEDMTPKFKDTESVTEEVMQGSVLLSSQSTRKVCDNTGYCIDQTVTSSHREPRDVKVFTGGGTVCFKNEGHLDKTTEEITLHLDDPSPPSAGMFTGLMGRVAFRWKFN